MKSEQWKTVPGYVGRYAVSNIGRVKSLKMRKPLSLVRNKRGYVAVNLYKNGRVRNFTVHRLVAAAFIGEIPEGYHVNHKNGVKTDNRVTNLEIVTPEENRRHAVETGLTKYRRGSENENAKLTEDDVLEIRRMRAEGVVARKVAILFDITERHVLAIQHRLSWAHLP
jgi:hypothetical protein